MLNQNPFTDLKYTIFKWAPILVSGEQDGGNHEARERDCGVGEKEPDGDHNHVCFTLMSRNRVRDRGIREQGLARHGHSLQQKDLLRCTKDATEGQV